MLSKSSAVKLTTGVGSKVQNYGVRFVRFFSLNIVSDSFGPMQIFNSTKGLSRTAIARTSL